MMKKLISFLLAAILIFTCFANSFALMADSRWEEYYSQYMQNGYGSILQPGSDESQRNFSWYSPLGSGKAKVIISENSDFSNSLEFAGKSYLTFDGDLTNKATVTGLLGGKTYYYRLMSGDTVCQEAYFNTIQDNSFSAVYLTDIHVSREQDELENPLVHQSYTVNEVVKKANEVKNLDLIISAGDQASYGQREEYESLVASPFIKTCPFALAIGNHDRKGIDYRFFNNNPNQYKKGITSFQGGDYWYVKGNVLFFVLDSNSKTATNHRLFVKQAVEKNPDVKWRVAVCHHDMYGRLSSGREDDANENTRPVMVPIFDEFKIDLVLLGHSHYYSMSSVLFNNEVVTSLEGEKSVADAAGTIYMVSGSVNRPKTKEDGLSVPQQAQCAYSYPTDSVIYNIIEFSDETININSYTYEDEEPFHTFKINKTSNNGGHIEYNGTISDALKRSTFQFLGVFEEFGTGVGRAFEKIFNI